MISLSNRKISSAHYKHYEGIWVSFRKSVFSEIQKIEISENKHRIPFETAKSVLKRMVYEFIIEHRETSKLKYLESVISDDREEGRPIRIRFDENPFHHVFFALSKHVSVGRFSISKWDVSRFGKQLLYAQRHEVLPEYLIGFLYQCGSVSEIEAKVDDANFREEWYKRRKIRANEPI